MTKTDLKGRITYANDVFLRVAHLAAGEALGQPHSVIRHPGMPRCAFRLLWETITAGGEFFGYVENLALNGDHYWVFAHVTPSYGPGGEMVGYHSNRRMPDPGQVARIEPLYQALLREGGRHEDRKQGMQAGTDLLHALLRERGVS